LGFKDERYTLGQTAYAMFLTEPPTPGDVVQAGRNRELYNMFVTAIMDGSGIHILIGVRVDEGYDVAKEQLTGDPNLSPVCSSNSNSRTRSVERRKRLAQEGPAVQEN
jgi:hypothetical protein